MDRGRENQLQFLRVLAFANVFMLHAQGWNFINYPSMFGSIASITFFFMLSGFLTGYGYTDRKAEFGRKEYFQYLKRKIVQFYPLYFVVNICCVASSAIPRLIGEANFPGLTEPVLQLVKTLLCVQVWSPKEYFAFYGASWFSATLLFLNALNLPFFKLLRKVNHLRRRNLTLCAMAAVCFGYTFIYSWFTRHLELRFYHYVFPLSRIGIYFGSVALGMLMRPFVEKVRRMEKKTVLFTLLEAGALVLWFVSLRFSGPEWMEWNASWILPNIMVLFAFIFGMGGLSRLFCAKPLVAMGNVVMECYLVHVIIINVYHRINAFDPRFKWGCLFSLVFCFALTFLVAFTIKKGQQARNG